MRFMHPYIGYVTYRFHVEKCREIGKLELFIKTIKRKQKN